MRRRLIVPEIPFLFSLSLSLLTVGRHVYWQDSGFFLVGVKDLSVLYPPGFVLYLLVCKAWTLLLFFVDFTLAVHLFSSLCAALAAGTLAVGVRELLSARNPLFKVVEPGEGGWVEGAAVGAGCLAAVGYTFWFSGLYAKGYALYYLILALLLVRLIRAHETGERKEFTWAAALIGLAWQAHPSAATLGAAFLLFIGWHAKLLGLRGVAWRAGLAAACAAGPVALVLPLLSARDPALAFGEVTSLGDVVDYLRGARFVEVPGVFGLDPSRAASVGQFLWEELLGVGLALMAAGLARAALKNRRLLLGVAAWVVPSTAITVLFKMEGQHDLWFIASWMPLYLMAGLGLHLLARYGRVAVCAAVLVAAAWGALVNYPLLRLRGYELAELYGRIHLENLDPNAVLLLRGDDALATCHYLQRVRGFRPDVTLVHSRFLPLAWYRRSLLRRHPRIAPGPDAAAFALANAREGHPIFFSEKPPAEALRPDYAAVPAGPYWKLVRRGSERIDPRYWIFPVEAEEARRHYRRARGQVLEYGPHGVDVVPDFYERRLVFLLLRARKNLADWEWATGSPQSLERSARLYLSILHVAPELEEDPGLPYRLGVALVATGRAGEAEPFLRRAAAGAETPTLEAGALLHLGEIARSRGREKEAQSLFRQALDVHGVDPELRREIERRLRP